MAEEYVDFIEVSKEKSFDEIFDDITSRNFSLSGDHLIKDFIINKDNLSKLNVSQLIGIKGILRRLITSRLSITDLEIYQEKIRIHLGTL